MKRRQNRSILEFMRKVPRTESLEQDNNENISQMSFEKVDSRPTNKASISVTVPAGDEEELATTLDLQHCWSLRQYEEFKKNYVGLIVVGKKLCCCHCATVHSINVKRIHVSVEWGNCNVKA